MELGTAGGSCIAVGAGGGGLRMEMLLVALALSESSRYGEENRLIPEEQESNDKTAPCWPFSGWMLNTAVQ